MKYKTYIARGSYSIHRKTANQENNAITAKMEFDWVMSENKNKRQPTHRISRH